MQNWNEFKLRVQDRYTPSELIELLGVDMDTLLEGLYDSIRPLFDENEDEFRDLFDEED
jgi:hypothetical protein